MSDLFTVLEVATAGGLLGAGAWAAYRPVAGMISYEVRFPAGLKPGQVQSVLDVIASVGSPVVLTVEGSEHGLRFGLAASRTTGVAIERAAAGIASQVRLSKSKPGDSEPVWTRGVRIRWSGRWPLLRDDDASLATAGLLGSLSELGIGERMQVRLLLRPVRSRPVLPAQRADGGRQLPADQSRRIRAKFSARVVKVEVTVLTSARPPVRAQQLLSQVTAVVRAREGLRGRVVTRQLKGRAARRAGTVRRSSSGTLVSTAELVALTGWPIDSPQVNGLQLGTAPSLLPSSSVPVRGRVWATSDAGKQRPIAQPIAGALRHALVLGGTGSGKSTLIAGLVEQDLRDGRGCLVVDVKGDLIDDLLARVPQERRGEVVVLDPSASDPQPGLTLFGTGGGDVELAADVVVGTLREIYPDSFGIRSAHYLRIGLATLARQPQATLVDLPVLLSDRGFRNRALSRVDDPMLRMAWQRFESLSAADRAQHLMSPMTKLEELVGRGRLRLVLGQSKPKLNFNRALSSGQVVLVRLAPGELGAPAVRLLSALVLWQFFAAVEARSSVPPDRRRPFMAYIDEISALGRIGLPIDDLLTRARGFGVSVLVAPQQLSQLAGDLRAAVLANVGTICAFRLGHDDARVIAKELASVEPEQLQHMERFQVALRLDLAPGQNSSTMTGVTLPMSKPLSDPAIVRRDAGARFGMTLQDVDSELSRRLAIDVLQPQVQRPAVPVGRRRRSS